VVPDPRYGFDTRAIHAGQRPDPETGARAMPIYASTSFVFEDAQQAADLFSLQTFGNIYSRLGNPTNAAFEERMASLEGGLGALAAASGASAQLVALLALVVITVFWWVTMWFLLAGRISWRRLLPGAVATAVFWIGMEVVFHFIFSNTIISDDKKYGAIGIVFALMSWLIAIGVVVILGPVVGIVWDERQLSFSGAFRKLRRSGRDQGTDTQAAAEQPVEERAAVGDDAAP